MNDIMLAHTTYRRTLGLLLALLLLIIAACDSSSAGPAHTLKVSVTTPQPLTFYEGPDETEPFTPLFASQGPSGTVLTMGFAQNEGAYYIETYNGTSWQVAATSNGFAASDPQWDCDEEIETSVVIAPDATMIARPCTNGSVTIFSLPNALVLYHQDMPATNGGGLVDRSPVVAFAPDAAKVAITDDSPAGPGHKLTLLSTHSWQKLQTITLDAQFLSRPSWSPDGQHIAAVDLAGTVHIWDTTTGSAVASATISSFNIGTAGSDPAGPAPQWSPDGKMVYTTAPATHGSVISAWSFTGGTLTSQGATTIAFTPNKLDPQIAPDGQLLFVHTAINHGQLFTAPALKQVADFDLPGTLTLWGTDAHQLNAFTLQSTVVRLQVGA